MATYSTHSVSSVSAVAGPGENGDYSRHSGSHLRSTHSHRDRSDLRRSLDRDRSSSKRDNARDSIEHERRRSSGGRPAREDREKRERREYTPQPPPSSADRDRRERSPLTARSSGNRGVVAFRPSTSPPPKKRRRTVPRYVVQIPKVSLLLARADVWELKLRYQNLYIPSDFFRSEVRWAEAFPADSPFVLRQPCAFQLMHKEVEAPLAVVDDESLLNDPADTDSAFCARVMLMGVPPMADIYRQCFVAAEHEGERAEGSEHQHGGEGERNLVHPSRMISFLVGQRGPKNETMAIGGPWSPSLDGKHPESDPTVLIRTAIRTCKALTGIDLSRCTQW